MMNKNYFKGIALFISTIVVVLVFPHIFASGHGISMLTQICISIVFLCLTICC